MKKPPSDDQALQADAPITTATPMTEAEHALKEIDEAAQLVFKSQESEVSTDVSAETPKVGASYAQPTALTEGQKAERIKVYTKRAVNQRDKGRTELARTYAGAMSVEMTLNFNDLTVASSCERFLGICDVAPYTIGRRGPSVLGSKGTTAVLEQFNDLVETYYLAGKEAQHEAQTLFNVEREKILSEDEWITPSYRTAAFAMQFNAKHRGTGRLVGGMKLWDEAIRLATVLEWNGKIQTAMIAGIRESERKGMYKVFSFASRSLIGLYRNTLKAPEAKPQKVDSEAGKNEAEAETAVAA